MKNNLPLIFISLLTVLVQAQEKDLQYIDSFIMVQKTQYHIPGIAACVVKGDSIVWSGAYGYANIEMEKPMSIESLINIASISKTITATAIMQLWEKGNLELDVDIGNYLHFGVRNPYFPDLPITIRQLLTHTSSIADAPSIKIGYQCGDPDTSLKEWISNYFKPTGLYYDSTANFHEEAPDSLREYSNVGFGLLGLIVEEVAGVSFNSYVQQNIFNPLKMYDSGYFLSEIDTNKLAIPYLYLGPLQKSLGTNQQSKLPYFNPYCHYSFWNYPDGLVRTSVKDLSKFALAYMHDGRFLGSQILMEETIDLMMSLQLSEKINGDRDQGLSWFQSPSLFPTWYHGGSDPGVSTRLYINKEDDLSVIVFQNANQDNSYYIVRMLYDYFK